MSNFDELARNFIENEIADFELIQHLVFLTYEIKLFWSHHQFQMNHHQSQILFHCRFLTLYFLRQKLKEFLLSPQVLVELPAVLLFSPQA